MEKNKIIKLTIRITIFLLLSIFIELLVFNYNNLFLIKNKGIYNVTDKLKQDTDNNKNFILELDKKTYISKLIIEYKTSENIKVNLIIDNDEKNVKNDTLNYMLKSNSIKINKKVKNIIINCSENVENLKIKKLIIDNNLDISYVRILFIFSIMLCWLILYKYYKNGGKTKKIHIVYLLISIIIGSNIIIIQPNTCFYSFDDQIHYENTLNLINFQNKIQQNEIYASTQSLFEDINSNDDIKQQDIYLNSNNEVIDRNYQFDSNIYSKIGYIPSAIGIIIGKILHMPFAICFKLGKLFNLLSFTLIMMFAIKKTKIGKRLLTVIALLPTSIFFAAQYSYDPAVTAGFVLAFVMLLNVFVDKNEKISLRWMIIFILSIIYASCVKAVYIPLILLFLFIPKDRFENEKNCKKVKIGVLLIFILMMSTFILPSVNGNMEGDSRGGATSVSEQLSYIIHHPINYLNILKNTMYNEFTDRFLGNNIIGGLAYIYKIGGNYYYLLLVLLIFVWITDYSKKINFKVKSLIFLNVIGIILLIWTALYLSFTPVRLNTIYGVQSRYFLPLLFPILICFKPFKISNQYKENKYNIFILTFISIILFVIIYNNFILSFGI